MSKKERTAITPTREQDYPEWYQQVVKAADMAENSPVRGCMVIKPWGYGIWERIQRELDDRIKATGHDNAYFPLFIPLSFLEKEAAHVDGFAKECAVVTHHRLQEKDGKLVPAGELEEPLIVRPTSETIIGDLFSKWVQSYRDLPLLINQWANVVRWEMRPRLFLRTAEFLWQEGHTVHVDEEDARKEVDVAVEMYRQLMEDILAMPVIIGEKTESERFPGAVSTVTLEAMMQDGKALQAGTSHYLGQNFAKASNIQFLGSDGELQHAHTTSWGVSTRLIGGMIMCHGDDDGLRVPPKAAPKHIVLLPVIPKPEHEEAVLAYVEQLAKDLRELRFAENRVVVHVDKRDLRGGEKSWQWVKKGIPIRIEVGPRDLENDSVMLFRRDQGAKDRNQLKRAEVLEQIPQILQGIQDTYFAQAKAYQEERTRSDITSLEEFQAYFKDTKSSLESGFVRAAWCGDEAATEKILGDLKVTIRCIPREQGEVSGNCVLTGKPAKVEALFAKAY
jgi:prolyl-tRNA synthetase